jgi:hypothetical protein
MFIHGKMMIYTLSLDRQEGPLPQELDHVTTANAVENLYQLFQLFKIIRDIVADLRDELDYLVTILGQRDREADSESTLPENSDDTSVAESLQYLRSKNELLMRWVINYMERTQIQINRFFNLATQKDSSINLNISQLTWKIAVSSQRDSSAMITFVSSSLFQVLFCFLFLFC